MKAVRPRRNDGDQRKPPFNLHRVLFPEPRLQWLGNKTRLSFCSCSRTRRDSLLARRVPQRGLACGLRQRRHLRTGVSARTMLGLIVLPERTHRERRVRHRPGRLRKAEYRTKVAHAV